MDIRELNRPRRPLARNLTPGDVVQLLPGVRYVVCNVECPPKAPQATIRAVGVETPYRYGRDSRVTVVGRAEWPRCQHF
ncbi:hypothetical protein QR97_01795 [Streptomyces sp. PBH53]|uniref:hypothetical protein n=1 Tax=Streptomyces sp. PBH53 TaxID=1577075 RepID=UPI00065500B9|nr:hypothetical protein [Streptomyces sp. PBH53]AKN68705.1 hypothetical protein QR97_01795 [Streptomyces sp. PBH53]